VTPSGTLTVRANGPDVVPERSRVTDERGDVRGVVVRVFGPVARPYYSVRPRRVPTPAEGVRLLGSALWME
jgi:rRNA processing protein Gar1